MSFWEHLEILRKHIIRGILVVIILSVVAFVFKAFIFDQIIFAPKSPEFITNYWLCSFADFINNKFQWDISAICINQTPLDLINIELAGQFRAHILVAIVTGLILGFPYLLFEILLFIRPALSKRERRGLRGFIVYTSFLFIIGVLFGYYLISPLTINFLNQYEVSADVEDKINLFSYITTVVMLALSSGIVFELPVLIYFLSKLGVVTPKILRKYRKYAIVIFLIVAGIITPPDVFSQILVAVPLLLLYELSISISARVQKRKLKAEAQFYKD